MWKSSKGNIENLLITGTYNFYVDVQLKGQSPFQNCTISINTFQKSNKQIAIPIICKWARVKGQRSYPLIGVNSNTYQFSSQDYSSIIKAEVQSQDEEFNGVAYVQLGPIKLDPQLKTSLEGILGTGGSKFPVQFYQDEQDILEKDISAILITSDHIRIEQLNRSIKFRYSLEFPIIEMNYLDTSKMAIIFKNQNEEFEKIYNFFRGINPYSKQHTSIRMNFKANSRNQRDLLLLTIKCFATKNYLVHSKIIHNIDLTLGDSKLFSEDSSKHRFTGDLLLEIESVKKDLQILIEINKELAIDKELSQKEIKKLEEELTDIIESYNTLLKEKQQFNNDHNQTNLFENSMIIQKPDQEIKRNLRNLQQKNHQLEKHVAELQQEIEVMKTLQGNNNQGYFEESRFLFKSNDFSEINWNFSNNNNNNKNIEQQNQSLTKQNEELRKKLDQLEKQIKEQQKIQTPENNFQSLRSTPTHNNFKFSLTTEPTLYSSIQNPKLFNGNNVEQLQNQIMSLQKSENEYKKQVETLTQILNQSKLGSNNNNYNNNSQESSKIKQLENFLSEARIQNETLIQEILLLKKQLNFENTPSINNKQNSSSKKKEFSPQQFQSPTGKEMKNNLKFLNQSPNTYRNQAENQIQHQQIQQQYGSSQIPQSSEKIPIKHSPMNNRSLQSESSLHEENQQMRDEINKLTHKNNLLQKQIEALQLENQSLKNQSFMKDSQVFNPDEINLKFIEERMQEQKQMNDRLLKELNVYKQKLKEYERLNPPSSRKNQKTLSFIFDSDQIDQNPQMQNLSDHYKLLQAENESLVNQRNQMSKKVESLQKELEAKAPQNNKQLEGLLQVNQKLVTENNSLTQQIRFLQDEIENLKGFSRSRVLDSSIYNNREEIIVLEKKLQEQMKINDEIMKIINEYKREIEDLKDKLTNLDNSRTSIRNNQSISQEFELNQAKRYREERDKCKLQNIKFQEENKQLSQQLQKLKERNDHLLLETNNMNEKINQLNNLIDDLKNKSFTSSIQSSNFNSEQLYKQKWQEEKDLNQNLLQNTEQLKLKIIQLETQLIHQQQLSQQKQNQKPQQQSQIQQQLLEQENQNLKKQIEQLMQQSKLQDLNSSQNSNLSDQLNVKSRVIQQLQNQNAKLIQENIELTDKMKELQEEVEMARSSVSYSNNASMSQDFKKNNNNIIQNLSGDKNYFIQENLNEDFATFSKKKYENSLKKVEDFQFDTNTFKQILWKDKSKQ